MTMQQISKISNQQDGLFILMVGREKFSARSQKWGLGVKKKPVSLAAFRKHQ